MNKVDQFHDYLIRLQRVVCSRIESLDGKAHFVADSWQSRLGYGDSRIIKDGAVFEKGGVNFSCVSADALPSAATSARPELAGRPFTALGVSLVMHPRNPYVPTTHMNVRFFAVGDNQCDWWFGGGYDLTPCYPFDEDCRSWHQTAKAACDPFGLHLYPQFKKQCDRYFYLPHRNETRGIGGLFFDDVRLESFLLSMALVQSVGDSFIHAYEPIVTRRKDMRWGKRERDFLEYRRGRYVEFNLLYDRGTLFGIQSGGRTESILMSMPPVVQWHYQWHAPPGSREADLSRYLKPAG